jgi:hypothetical protein
MDRDGGVRVILGRTPEGLIKIKKDDPLGLRAVNCACCAVECCMYPADKLGVLYTSADLPSAITLLGVGSLAKSGTSYGDTTNGVIFESGVWAQYIGGSRSTRNCLIAGKVQDQFPAVLTAGEEWTNGFYVINDSFILDRFSLCNWNYQDIDESVTTDVLLYWDPVVCKWQLTFARTSFVFGIFFSYVKDDPQNGPLGTYSGVLGTIGTITVT